MGKRAKKPDDGPKGDEWLATYADSITLLLTFFILLYAMASLDQQKVDRLSQAFKIVMGGESGDTLMEYDLYNGEVPLIGGEADIESVAGEAEEEKTQMYNEIKKFVIENGLTELVDIINTERGVVIQLRDNILFETSSSELIVESKYVLGKINSLIASLPNHIFVEGHTDNRPINTSKYPSNWELSVGRAVNVVRYFTETMGQNPARFSAAGYGEFHPVEPNDTESNMAKNRRVNILIMAMDTD